jgi:5-methylcytosine-specific restriction endonuclease McrA
MGIVSARVRKQVWRKCDGNCAYCGKPVDFKGPKGFQVDHLSPTYWNWKDEEFEGKELKRGTDDIDNLMPACKRCNKWKSSLTLDKFRDAIRHQNDVLIRDNTGYKLLVDYGIIKHLPWDGKFYFERMPGFRAITERVTSSVAV